LTGLKISKTDNTSSYNNYGYNVEVKSSEQKVLQYTVYVSWDGHECHRKPKLYFPGEWTDDLNKLHSQLTEKIGQKINPVRTQKQKIQKTKQEREEDLLRRFGLL
jgi:hypothetical protein